MDLNESTNEIKLNGNSIQYLNETRKWTNFLSIVGFIMVGFLFLVSFFIGTILGSIPNSSMIPKGMITVMYILIAILYFFPIYYLYQFSSHMKAGLITKSESEVEIAFSNLKSHYKFMGILLAIVLALYGMIFVFAILFGSLFG